MTIGKARGIALAALVVLVGAGLAACKGDGEDDGGGFTAAMVLGKTLYRELPDGEGLQKGLTTFTSATALTDREATPHGTFEEDGTWSIDATGRLLLAIGTNHLTLTLQSETADAFLVGVDDGSGEPGNVALSKTIPAGGAFPGRYVVQDRDVLGVTRTAGVATFGAGGSSVLADGLSEDVGTWTAEADGAIRLRSGKPEEVFLYLLAGSDTAAPKSLRMVGRVHDLEAGGLRGIADVTFEQTPAASGFTHESVVDEVVYRESTASQLRSLIQYQSTGARPEWLEDAVNPPSFRVWEWTVTDEVLRIGPTASEYGALLVDDTATSWEVLMNGGVPDAPLTSWSLTKTIALTEEAVIGTWATSERELDGSTTPGGTVVLSAGGTGTAPDGGALTWLLTADGWVAVTTGTEDIYFRVLATSAPPARIELAGYRTAGGGGYAGLLVTTLTRR
jgi:hypothetical protein